MRRIGDRVQVSFQERRHPGIRSLTLAAILIASGCTATGTGASPSADTPAGTPT